MENEKPAKRKSSGHSVYVVHQQEGPSFREQQTFRAFSNRNKALDFTEANPLPEGHFYGLQKLPIE